MEKKISPNRCLEKTIKSTVKLSNGFYFFAMLNPVTRVTAYFYPRLSAQDRLTPGDRSV
jgi:hypothetical protein